MFVTPPYCEPPEVIKRECLPYYEYYLGDKDEHKRKHGRGQNYWTGPKSIEWHDGHFVRDSMHGPGEYRCRYRSKPGLFLTYEGRMYLNQVHGYGVMSYPDGKVYTGLFNNDMRYGPGVETFANVHANVGLWRGTKLVRLAWRPALSVVPEFQATVGGRALVDPLRVVLHAAFKTIDKVKQAVEFLKQQGSDPVSATENWSRLYPAHCTDTASQLCHVELFDYEYYGGKICSLKQQGDTDDEEEVETESQDITGPYYAWNNDPVTIDMMKHCFKHEPQRKQAIIDLMSVLSGPRTAFKPPGMHELDCRTLLMGCYLGCVTNTVLLINERDVDPNIADMVGNTAVMYATCGDQATLINFLVEAGADVNSPNDSCCTPLGVALIRFLCARKNVPANGVMQALVPPPIVPAPPPELQIVFDWNITREMQTVESTKNILGKSPSKLNKMNIKNKSLTSIKVPDVPEPKKNVDTLRTIEENEPDTDLYNVVTNEYIIKVTDLVIDAIPQVTYLFDLNNMVDEIHEEQQKLVVPEKNPKLKASKMIKEPTKPSKEVIFQSSQKEEVSQTSIDTFKAEMFNRIKLTILQLLECGAKPSLVRCPHPALAMAVMAGCPEVVRHLVRHGADVNEVYPQHLSYTPLEMALSQPLNQTTLDMVQALLEAGARADCRLRYVHQTSDTDHTEPGPTLLHALLVKKADTEPEEDIRRQIMHLLLEYNCDPLKRFKGRSALDEATRNLDLLDIIIKSPKTDLNAAIDDSNQTILVKMFWMPYFKGLGSTERSQALTNLLLFGADPLIECVCEGVKYKNLFVLVKRTLRELSNRTPGGSKSKISTIKGQKLEAKPSVTKGKKAEPKKTDAMASDDIANLRQAIDLMTECSRILYIRWLQTQLAKEIIGIINRYKHRHWSMMIKELKNKEAAGLWITAQRCLEIWSHLKTTRRKIYNDRTVLWNLLCIAHFFHLRSVTSCGFDKVTTAERDEAEAYAHSILKDNKRTEIVPLQRYVQPELFVNADSKFDVCFECFLPLTENRVLCQSCKFVSYCNMACLKDSIEKSNGHACNDYLVLKYFPSCESPATDGDDDLILKEPSVIK